MGNNKKKKGFLYNLRKYSVPLAALLLAVIIILSVMIVSQTKRIDASRADYDAKLESLSSRLDRALTATAAETTTTTTVAETTTTSEAPTTTTTLPETTTTTEAPTTTTAKSSSSTGKSSSKVTLNYDVLSVDEAGVKHVKPGDDATAAYFKKMQDDYAKIYAINKDTFGWIKVQGTGIDYEVMKSSDNSYYLNRTYEKKKEKHGSIFADYRVTNDFSKTRNCCMYGHCMTDGTMFRSVRYFFENKYGDRDKVAKTMKIELLINGKVYIYSIFSGYKSEGARFIHNVNTAECSESEFYEYLKELQTSDSTKKVLVKQDIPFNKKSRIATLCTCTNAPGKPDERWVLHCILTEIVEL